MNLCHVIYMQVSSHQTKQHTHKKNPQQHLPPPIQATDSCCGSSPAQYTGLPTIPNSGKPNSGMPAALHSPKSWRSFAFRRRIPEIRAEAKGGNENKLEWQPGTLLYLFTPLIKVMRNKTCCSEGRNWGFASGKAVVCVVWVWCVARLK